MSESQKLNIWAYLWGGLALFSYFFESQSYAAFICAGVVNAVGARVLIAFGK